MYNDAIAYLKEYKQEHLFLPKANWQECYLNERIGERWAINELISRMRAERDFNHKLLPCEVIYIFYKDMDKAAEEYDGDARHAETFYIAKRLAEELIYDFV